jgi:hypothetical protein
MRWEGNKNYLIQSRKSRTSPSTRRQNKISSAGVSSSKRARGSIPIKQNISVTIYYSTYGSSLQHIYVYLRKEITTHIQRVAKYVLLYGGVSCSGKIRKNACHSF